MKLLFENWRKFITEAEYPTLPSAGKYKVTLPLAKNLYTLFMKTIEKNLSDLQAVADDPKQLASALENAFDKTDLKVNFKVSKDRFNALGDGAFLHGQVSDPTETPEGELPQVTMILNKYTGEALKNWDTDMEISGPGFVSARTTTGKKFMTQVVKGTIVHEFVHQAQSQDPDIQMMGGTPDEWERLSKIFGISPDEDWGEELTPYIERQVSQEFLDDLNKSEEDKEIRDLLNKVYYSNESEFTGWAQAVPSDLIDMAETGRLPALKGLQGEELRQSVLNVIDQLMQNADQGVPKEIAAESSALRFYGNPEGFMATYGSAGYKEFLEIAKGFAEDYPESMYT